jgi:hypothetical protein
MIELVTVGVALLGLGAVALAAYHYGLREGRVRLPPELVAELREHKVHCIGEPLDRVTMEIALLCDSDSP